MNLIHVGGRYKSWKRRWFILSDSCLYYFLFTTVSLSHLLVIKCRHLCLQILERYMLVLLLVSRKMTAFVLCCFEILIFKACVGWVAIALLLNSRIKNQKESFRWKMSECEKCRIVTSRTVLSSIRILMTSSRLARRTLKGK